ncbi:hypothetical protein KCP73_08050 [Salmonella enterica subsp. enterica]|nr:hypothetical protein KCP73_08050 [Salmonella enterica subsp. enterica]
MTINRTLNLPETGFPMRGDLAKREPNADAGPMMICILASFARPKRQNLHSA